MGNKKIEEKINNNLMATVVWIPKNTYKMKIRAWVDDHEFGLKMDKDMIEKAREDYLYLDPDDDAFAVYGISESFKAFLNSGGDINDLESYFEFIEKYGGVDE